MNDSQQLLLDSNQSGISKEAKTSTVRLLATIPEENIWLAGQQSPGTRRIYKADVSDFIISLDIQSTDDLRLVNRMAVVAWKRILEKRKLKPRTIRRKLSSLSSLYSHLVEKHIIEINPVREIKRPPVNRKQGTTAAFSVSQVRAILDAPSPNTLTGIRDRAILSVGFQVGARRSEIVNLRVRDYHLNRGFSSLHFIRKGGQDHSLAINPQTAKRIDDYLVVAGHGDAPELPLFLPVKKSAKNPDMKRFLHPDRVDNILKRYAREIGIKRGFSAHSMRATFITRALENGAPLEEVQRAAGHADASTTRLYDKRGYDPEKSASFFASY